MTISSVASGQAEDREFDHCVLANGHFERAFIPLVPGLKDFQVSKKQRRILHSRWYRGPEPFADETVLVVGNSSSGYDITREIATAIYERRTRGEVGMKRIYQSARGPSGIGIPFDAPDAPEWAAEIQVLPTIKQIHEDGRVEFDNGQRLNDVDTM